MLINIFNAKYQEKYPSVKKCKDEFFKFLNRLKGRLAVQYGSIQNGFPKHQL